MAKQDMREFPQLPSHDNIKKAAFKYILSGKPYLGSDLTKFVADVLGVTADQRALRLKNGRPAFENYVDHVKREFTSEGIHTGPNGGKHKGKDELYYVTDQGRAIARRETEVQFLAPTDDPKLLQSQTNEALSRMRSDGGGLPPPPYGSTDVQQVQVTTTRFVRDPKVSVSVLLQAHGACEVCDSPAPFRNSDGHPFLEIHHVRPLASGGPDTVDNAIAVCPNCHRELHFGDRQEARRSEVIEKVARLKDHRIRQLGNTVAPA
jgi:hypothetical protein